jgi:para-nitrobenzyl esterase
MTVPPDTAEITTGPVSGARGALATAFLGIPYATATRLAPPGPPAPWAALEATSFGPASPQPRRPTGDSVFGPAAALAEQCLSLNVWTPNGAARALPVLAYIHGGGFIVGRSGCAALDGARLADAAQAVVVTFNYRLGSAGWLSHPALAAGPGGAIGNWGLLDQVAALEWIRANIARFAGDPGRVTLAGQSAGALSVIDLLAAPGAAGLFERAIVQSPPIADAVADSQLTERWAEAVSGGDPAALRELSAEQLCELHERTLAEPAFRGTRGGALPRLDPASLPHGPYEEAAASPEVPVLLGTTADEGTFFAYLTAPPGDWSEQDLIDRVAHLPGLDAERAGELVARAGDGPPRERFARIATDAFIAGPALDWGRRRVRAGSAAVHRYRVDHRSPRAELGATHSVDVGLMFATCGSDPVTAAFCGDGPEAAAASRSLIAMVRGFVHGEEPQWPALSVGEEADGAVAVIGGATPWRIANG